jgi:hypothetical protein
MTPFDYAFTQLVATLAELIKVRELAGPKLLQPWSATFCCACHTSSPMLALLMR